MANNRGRKPQREKLVPPHASLVVIRKLMHLSLDDVAARIEEITGRRPTRGALSAIENGHRGASNEMLSDLERAYGLEPGSLTTAYRPRTRHGEAMAS